jgi:hypothetical protein
LQKKKAGRIPSSGKQEKKVGRGMGAKEWGKAEAIEGWNPEH